MMNEILKAEILKDEQLEKIIGGIGGALIQSPFRSRHERKNNNLQIIGGQANSQNQCDNIDSLVS